MSTDNKTAQSQNFNPTEVQGTPSNGNVFADIGLPCPELRLELATANRELAALRSQLKAMTRERNDEVRNAKWEADRAIEATELANSLRVQLDAALAKLTAAGKDGARLDWLLGEVRNETWSPRFIAWMTETTRTRASIDAVRRKGGA